ncbi:hypothetical protein EDC01DRAFT_629579 [Geopyxis carbonaria]|nr:hypothetical protein EDC01DRAFT_629579 [Geopyxis carbonaria]
MSGNNQHRSRQRNWDDASIQQAFATKNDNVHRPIEFVYGFTFSQEYLEYLHEYFHKDSCVGPVRRDNATQSSYIDYICTSCSARAQFNSAEKMTCKSCQKTVFIKAKKRG